MVSFNFRVDKSGTTITNTSGRQFFTPKSGGSRSSGSNRNQNNNTTPVNSLPTGVTKITLADGSVKYSIGNNNRFDSVNAALAGQLRRNNPSAFNSNSSFYYSDDAKRIRELEANLGGQTIYSGNTPQSLKVFNTTTGQVSWVGKDGVRYDSQERAVSSFGVNEVKLPSSVPARFKGYVTDPKSGRVVSIVKQSPVEDGGGVRVETPVRDLRNDLRNLFANNIFDRNRVDDKTYIRALPKEDVVRINNENNRLFFFRDFSNRLNVTRSGANDFYKDNPSLASAFYNFSVGAGSSAFSSGLGFVEDVLPFNNNGFRVPLTNTAQGISYVVQNPGVVVSSTIASAKENPFLFSGDVLGNVYTFNKLSSVASNLSKKGLVNIQSFGKKFIPSEKLVVPDVLAGVKNFPTAKNVSDALKNYYGEGYNTRVLGGDYLYSATDYFFKPFKRDIKVISGRGLKKFEDVPGLYASSRGVSTYFLRLKSGFDKSLSNYKLLPSLDDFLPKFPKILAVEGRPVRIPKKYLGSLEDAQSFFGKNKFTVDAAKSGVKNVDDLVAKYTLGKKGKGYFTPALEFGLKNEAEVVVQVGSRFERVGLNTTWEKLTGFKEFTIVDGVKIPIYRLRNISDDVVSVNKKLTGLDKLSLDKYYYSSKTPLVNVSSVFGSLGSLKNSLNYSSNSSKFYSFGKSSNISLISSKGNSEYYFSNVGSSFVSNSFSSKKSNVSSLKSSVSSSGSPSISSTSSSSNKSINDYPVVSYNPSKINNYSYNIPKFNSSKYFINKNDYKLPKYNSSSFVPNYNSGLKDFVKKKISNKNFSSKSYRGVGYDVYVRRQGKYFKLRDDLPKNLAINVGADYVRSNSTRSFYIQRDKFTSLKDSKRTNLSDFRKPKFNSKLKRYSFVEKSKYAINTVGELLEIPGKARVVNRGRKRVRKK